MSTLAPHQSSSSYQIKSEPVHTLVLVAGIVSAAFYAFIFFYWLKVGNGYLYFFLALGEIFHLWLILTYIFTVWPRSRKQVFNPHFAPAIDVMITVAGEPIEIVRQTALTCKNMNYPNHKVYILNDGLVCGADNWQEIVQLAKNIGVGCITRKKSGGAKAGNINNGLTETKSEIIAVFDADHCPSPDFLRYTAGYFADPKVAFVQTPQYYHNFDNNPVTLGASEQQELFFGAILQGKNNTNAAFMCGTNMLIRRQALAQVGGMCDTNIAEDFLTSLLIHEKGWSSIYVPKVLSHGLAPEDFLSYCKQQFRWARGSLEVIFRYNPLFRRGLTLSQKIHYLSSASYYLSGFFVIVNLVIPVLFLLFGWEPMYSSSMVLASAFLPYLFLCIFIIQKSSSSSYTFKALGFSMGSFWIFFTALISMLLGQKASFKITSKTKLEGNFVNLIYPHLVYFGISTLATVYAISIEGFSAAVITNFAWITFNNISFLPFMRAALPENIFERINVFEQFRLSKKSVEVVTE